MEITIKELKNPILKICIINDLFFLKVVILILLIIVQSFACISNDTFIIIFFLSQIYIINSKYAQS